MTMNVDLENPVLNHNINLLINRQPGQRFRVNPSNQLELVTGISSIFYRLQQLFFCYDNRDVKRVISYTVQSITADKLDKLSDKGDRFCQQLFFDKMSRLSNAIFDREAIDSTVKARLIKKLEALRTQTFIKENSANQNYEDYFKTFSDRRQTYEHAFIDVLYRQHLGMDLTRVNGGSSGVYVGKNVRNVSVLAFKPFDEGSYGPNNPRLFQRIKRWIEENIFPYFIRPDLRRNTEYLSEAAASAGHEAILIALSKRGINDFDVIPFTRLEDFSSQAFKGPKRKICSCKMWLQNFRPASAEVPVWDLSMIGKGLRFYGNREIPRHLTEKFQWFAIMNFLFGDQDGHPDNIALQENNVVGFDFGLSGPRDHPNDRRSMNKQYAWAEFSNATEPFTETSKKIIEAIWDDQESIFAAVRAAGYDTNQEQAMLDRLKVLDRYRDRSPQELARVKTPEQFQKALGDNSSSSIY